MRIQIDTSSLRRIEWHEYLTRFLLGGAVTIVTGLIANGYGPVIGGLFLAFPAIFPASAALLDEHEREKKRKAGIPVTHRGRLAVARGCRRHLAPTETARLPIPQALVIPQIWGDA
jgi:hypothetical protein